MQNEQLDVFFLLLETMFGLLHAGSQRTHHVSSSGVVNRLLRVAEPVPYLTSVEHVSSLCLVKGSLHCISSFVTFVLRIISSSSACMTRAVTMKSRICWSSCFVLNFW